MIIQFCARNWAAQISSRRLRRRCETRLAERGLSGAEDVRDLCSKVGQQEGRQIHLMATKLGSLGMSGIWISTPDMDYITYDAQTSRTHQDHIIAHELGHIICGHRGNKVLGNSTAQALFPDLDPETVERALDRTGYSDFHEREAEVTATIIMERMCRRAARTCWTNTAQPTEMIKRIKDSLG